MAGYTLTDPALQVEMDRLAAEEAAAWPAPDGEALAALARLLKPTPARPAQVVAPSVPVRRAA